MTVQSKVEVPTGLALLRQPFPPHQISKLPKPTKAQTEAVRADFKKGIRCQICGTWHHPDVVHLDYVGHAALTDRLLDCDPNWSWEPCVEPGLPNPGNGMWIKLTVCGVSRLGYGHADGKSGGDAIKETIGDALRNAAMRFGAALDLWHKGDLHIAEETPEQVETDTPQGRAEYPFPEGPAKNITELKNLLRPLWREVKGCNDLSELAGLEHSYAALIDQTSRLENPTHRRELWEGDGKDNPGLQGLLDDTRAAFGAPTILQAG
jgi:hypothetical protein